MTDAVAGEPERRSINIDRVTEVMKLGVRRAMAFIGSAERYAAIPPPTSLSLSTMAAFRVLPDPLPGETAEAYQKEFFLWSLGNALAELDRFFHLYLDQVWHVAELVEDGPALRADRELVSIERQTNSATKLVQVTNRIGAADQQSPHWATLANVRNCLMHQAGRVTPSKVNHDGRLRVSWRRFESAIETDDGERFVLNERDEPLFLENGGRAVVTVADHHIDFEVGEQVLIRAQHLSEICLYYQMAAELISRRLVEHCREKGLNIVGPAGAAPGEPA